MQLEAKAEAKGVWAFEAKAKIRTFWNQGQKSRTVLENKQIKSVLWFIGKVVFANK